MRAARSLRLGHGKAERSSPCSTHQLETTMMETPDTSTPQGRRRVRTNARLGDALKQISNDTMRRRARQIWHASPESDAMRSIPTFWLSFEISGDGSHKRSKSDLDLYRKATRDLKIQAVDLATQNAVLLSRALGAEEWAARAERRNADLVKDIRALRRPSTFRGAPRPESELHQSCCHDLCSGSLPRHHEPIRRNHDANENRSDEAVWRTERIRH